MYIVIDCERMVLLHKHPEMEVCANLAWIECQSTSYCIFSLYDASGFREFTDMALAILYRNITGEDNHNLSRRPLLQVIFDLCVRTTVSDVVKYEVNRQAEFIPEDSLKKWLYVKGATLPAQKPELFEPACKRAKQNENEEVSARGGKLPALTEAVHPCTASAPEHNTTLTPVAKKGPKRGTAKAIIWEEADKAWTEVGKPDDKAQILILRKAIMAHLETNYGIKKGSSSSELGQWHKKRAPFNLQ